MESSGPDPAHRAEKAEEKESRPPPGEFLSPDFESDTARFLRELRSRLRRRAEETRSVELGRPQDEDK